jgi:hypothetical protein
MQNEYQELLRKSVVPLKYPAESITNSSCVGYSYLTAQKDLASFDPAVHNAVMFDQNVRTTSGFSTNTPAMVQYSIPQIGEYCLRFCLQSDAVRADFAINESVISKWENLKGGVWYDLFDRPVNLFAAPYGQRFLTVEYASEGFRDVTFRYLSTDDKTRRATIDIVIANK